MVRVLCSIEHLYSIEGILARSLKIQNTICKKNNVLFSCVPRQTLNGHLAIFTTLQLIKVKFIF